MDTNSCVTAYVSLRTTAKSPRDFSGLVGGGLRTQYSLWEQSHCNTLPLMEVFDGKQLLEVINFTATLGFGTFRSDPQTHGNKRLNSIWTAMPGLPAGRELRKKKQEKHRRCTFLAGAPPSLYLRLFPFARAIGCKSQNVTSKHRDLVECLVQTRCPCSFYAF